MLYVFTDDGLTTIEYVQLNGVYPSKYALKSESMKQILPFVTQDDKILVIIKGFIEWTQAQVATLFEDVEEVVERVGGLYIISNIELGMGLNYTFLDGDLFYGQYTDIRGKKKGKPKPANLLELLSEYRQPCECVCIDEMSEEVEVPLNMRVDISQTLVRIDLEKMVKEGHYKVREIKTAEEPEEQPPVEKPKKRSLIGRLFGKV